MISAYAIFILVCTVRAKCKYFYDLNYDRYSYRPQTKFREGNVFTAVSQSTGVYFPTVLGTHPTEVHSFHRPEMKLWEGNVFRRACLFTVGSAFP